MPVFASPEEVRVEYSPEELAQIPRAFLVLYVAGAVIAAVYAAVAEPKLLLAVVGFSVMLGWWWRRMKSAPVQPYRLVITRDRFDLTRDGVERSVERSQVVTVRLREVAGRPMTTRAVELLDAAGHELLTEHVSAVDFPAVEVALEEFGWPLR
jgi:hypothetical protein